VAELRRTGQQFILTLDEHELGLLQGSLLNSVTGTSDEELRLFLGWSQSEILAFLRSIQDQQAALSEAGHRADLEADGTLPAAISALTPLLSAEPASLVRKLADLSALRGAALQSQDTRTTVLLSVQIDAVLDALASRPVELVSALRPLLSSPDPALRLTAATALLADHPSIAEPVLREIVALPAMTADFISLVAARALRTRP